MDDFQPTEDHRTDVFVELDAGPWWVCVLFLLAGAALFVVRGRVRRTVPRRLATVVAVLVTAFGFAATVLALIGPVRVG